MEISFKDIQRIIKRNSILIVAITLVFSVSAFFLTTFFMKKEYTSSVKLYVSANYQRNTANEDINTYNYTQKLVMIYLQILDTNSFYTLVSGELEDKYTPSELKEIITFENIENTGFFTVEVISESPIEAKKIADAVAEAIPVFVSEVVVDNYQLKIVDEATVPKKPTSPNMKMNLLLAFSIGMSISMVIAFIRYYLDNKIRYDEEMIDLCGVPVLAVIPDSEDKSYETLK